MTVFNEPLLIATAPDHILVGLGLFFTFAGVSLFCQAVEQGVYPRFRGRLVELFQRFARHRQRKQLWVRYAIGGTRYAQAAC